MQFVVGLFDHGRDVGQWALVGGHFLEVLGALCKVAHKISIKYTAMNIPSSIHSIIFMIPPRNERVFSTRISFFNVATPQMAAYTGTAISLFLTLKNGLENIENERSTSSSMSH